ncbi:arogenate dehydratase/prephenate dehydratase 2 [Quercus suber]|uniref:arogenate dehydratase n=1 Tax=Quercus suber TaxID=58331 RepID=A0AAW0KIZ7_QUESU
MASSIVRSPLNPISRHVTRKPSPSDHGSRTTTTAAVTIHRPYPNQRRRRNVPVLACSLQSHNADDNHNVAGGRSKTELQKIPDDSPYDDVSKDPNNNTNMLPRPLSSTQSSNSVSHLRVAYQGVRGAYSESAAEKAYPFCEAVPCEQFETAFEAVERWLVDRAVLPIENSLGGSIHRNYDLLLRHRLHIVGEVKFAVRHCLMANHGVKLEDLKRVLSHPQALAQCEHTLTRLGLVREAVDDTAGAAKDDSDNVTRFLMLAREPIVPGTDKPFKTSIVFSLEEGPGVLFKALAVFALREINLTKIESRPLRKQLVGASDDNNNGYPKYFDYLFYVDFEASMADQNAQNALGHLREFSTYLRVLGSYPVDTIML